MKCYNKVQFVESRLWIKKKKKTMRVFCYFIIHNIMVINNNVKQFGTLMNYTDIVNV